MTWSSSLPVLRRCAQRMTHASVGLSSVTALRMQTTPPRRALAPLPWQWRHMRASTVPHSILLVHELGLLNARILITDHTHAWPQWREEGMIDAEAKEDEHWSSEGFRRHTFAHQRRAVDMTTMVATMRFMRGHWFCHRVHSTASCFRWSLVQVSGEYACARYCHRDRAMEVTNQTKAIVKG